ncbi:NGP1NT (NUC091) domain protein, partial [Toxoplasma gondii FOU]
MTDGSVWFPGHRAPRSTQRRKRFFLCLPPSSTFAVGSVPPPFSFPFFSVVLKRSKLPLSLLAPSAPGRTEHFDEGGQEMSTVPQTRGSAILSLQSFSDTFGDKRTRKRPQLQASDLGELARQAERRQASFQEGRGGAGGEDEGDETAFSRDDPRGQDSGGETAAASEKIFKKGTSRRIWG